MHTTQTSKPSATELRAIRRMANRIADITRKLENEQEHGYLLFARLAEMTATARVIEKRLERFSDRQVQERNDE